MFSITGMCLSVFWKGKWQFKQGHALCQRFVIVSFRCITPLRRLIQHRALLNTLHWVMHCNDKVLISIKNLKDIQLFSSGEAAADSSAALPSWDEVAAISPKLLQITRRQSFSSTSSSRSWKVKLLHKKMKSSPLFRYLIYY